MKISFDFDLNDWLEFNKYHYYNNRSKINIKGVFLIIFMLYVIFIYFIENIIDYRFLFFLGLYIIIIFIFSFLKLEEKIFIYYIKKYLNKGNNASIIGKHIIQFNDEYIEISEPGSDSKIYWSKIYKIEQTENYIFIYINSVSAIIIPKLKISNDDINNINKFLENL